MSAKIGFGSRRQRGAERIEHAGPRAAAFDQRIDQGGGELRLAEQAARPQRANPVAQLAKAFRPRLVLGIHGDRAGHGERVAALEIAIGVVEDHVGQVRQGGERRTQLAVERVEAGGQGAGVGAVARAVVRVGSGQGVGRGDGDDAGVRRVEPDMRIERAAGRRGPAAVRPSMSISVTTRASPASAAIGLARNNSKSLPTQNTRSARLNAMASEGRRA